ncbi:MAG TPA: polysaccharide pyruvyl transferase family protein [Flavobacteriaceae bacterium]|nr:polysaccharide pyruvyl transferase family protein [Flavobacteriaceae bacterium]HIN99695.1 polysaccharide pyruvyl transferase family protein [Flavobacteriaceae bacterium]
MALRTYYWNTRKVSKWKYYKTRWRTPHKMVLKYGNAGDIYNADLIRYLYNEMPINLTKQESRLLLVGSIASVIEKNDIVCGIGWKGNDLSNKREIIERAKVYGVRGPLTRSLFEQCNADLSTLKFEYDPGLLIREVYDLDLKTSKNGKPIFIPHYRDNWKYNGKYPKEIKFVSIDNEPKRLAVEILKSSVVYTSSLHGIIFSHALKKECVFVAPQTEEPIFKYQDYFLSINQKLPEPIKHIYDFNFSKDKTTFLDKEIGIDQFYFPSKEELTKREILV